jgi:putative transposase
MLHGHVGIWFGVMKAYKTELAPNNIQRTFFARCAGASRFAYNWGLATWKQWYEDGKKPSAYSLRREFNAIKYEQCSWITELPYTVTEGAFYNLGAAFQHFFRRVKNGDNKVGYPKFKSRRHPKQSFHLKNTKVQFDRVRLQGIGWVRLKERNYIPTDVVKYGTYATVSRQAGRWYISVLAYEDESEPVNNSTLVIGADFGLKTLVVLSNGETFENPHCLIQAEQKLKRLQRELARRKKGGANWRKTKAKLQRQYTKVTNVRKHILHNISHHVTFDLMPKTIVLEDLNVRGMMSNHHLAKAISDVGFYELRRQIEYKAKERGIEVIVADRWYPSSKTCSACGWKNDDLALSDRVFQCPQCGLITDRDLNAAQNLASYREGQNMPGLPVELVGLPITEKQELGRLI